MAGKKIHAATVLPYKRFMTRTRAATSRVSNRTLEEEADSDRGRVFFSAPFRRMQNKAQVFALESNASVRSRLTHCIEVSSIGRYIAQQIVSVFQKKKLLDAVGLQGAERAFIQFVETACLLHDIGNPPFGHFGELAIQSWFHENEKTLKRAVGFDGLGEALQKIWGTYYDDFVNFDGNPQGFRIVTKLQPKRENDVDGLNLTLTQLGAIVKYPWSTADLGPGRKKGGFFETERETADLVRKEFGLPANRRHPLVYVMEAADDIAYCLSDLEDGVEKRLFEPQELAAFVAQKMDDAGVSPEYEEVRNELFVLAAAKAPLHHDPLWEFRSAAIRALVQRAARNYVDRHDSILSGEPRDLLDANGAPNEVLGSVKAFAHARLYTSRPVRSREITAHRVITGLLDAHLPLLKADTDRFNCALAGKSKDGQESRITVESSLVSRLPKKQRHAYESAVSSLGSMTASKKKVIEWMLRAHWIVDFVSGMTDDFALQTYQLVSGMRADLPS